MAESMPSGFRQLVPNNGKHRQIAPQLRPAWFEQYAIKVGTLLRLPPLAMASAIATTCAAVSSAPVPCEVLSTSGQWICGYELLRFCDNGLLSIRSTHTGDVRQLPLECWRDPAEEALLEASPRGS